jgi:hypothetical protein
MLVPPKFIMPVKIGIHAASKNLDTGPGSGPRQALRGYDERKV